MKELQQQLHWAQEATKRAELQHTKDLRRQAVKQAADAELAATRAELAAEQEALKAARRAFDFERTAAFNLSMRPFTHTLTHTLRLAHSAIAKPAPEPEAEFWPRFQLQWPIFWEWSAGIPRCRRPSNPA